MVWGTIHQWIGGVGWILNRQHYFSLLRDSMLAWATGVFRWSFVYVNDNAMPHTACGTTAFLEQQDVEDLYWPPQSPDMKSTEHVWNQRGFWTRDMDDTPSTVSELRQAVLQTWAAVPPRRVIALVGSMPCPVRAVLATRGGPTRYEWCVDMAVSMFVRLIKKLWSYGICFSFTKLLFHCAVSPLRGCL